MGFSSSFGAGIFCLIVAVILWGGAAYVAEESLVVSITILGISYTAIFASVSLIIISQENKRITKLHEKINERITKLDKKLNDILKRLPKKEKS